LILKSKEVSRRQSNNSLIQTQKVLFSLTVCTN